MDKPLISFSSFAELGIADLGISVLDYLKEAVCSSAALTGIRYGSSKALQLKFGSDNFIENMFCAEKIALLPSYVD